MKYSTFDSELVELSTTWLQKYFDSHIVSQVRTGVCGRIFVLNAIEDDTIVFAPAQIAIKSIRAIDGIDLDELADSFERELRLIMPAYKHLNIVPFHHVLGMHTTSGTIPFATMPHYDLNLREWCDLLGRPKQSDAALILANICNGLSWAYGYGIEGHGDLKLENILCRKVGTVRESFESESLRASFPWNISVADFGWANIWQSFPDETMKGYRPYLAPERYDGYFAPGASDVFSVGVIASELIQGIHPVGLEFNAKKLQTWKPNRWRNWARSDDRELSRIDDEDTQSVVRRCLSCDPAGRPSVEELRDFFSTKADAEYHGEVGCWLAMVNSKFDQFSAEIRDESKRWIDKQVARVGWKARRQSIANGRRRLENHNRSSAKNRTDWIVEAYQLVALMLDDYSQVNACHASTLAREMVGVVLESFQDPEFFDERLVAPQEVHGTNAKCVGVQLDHTEILASDYSLEELNHLEAEERRDLIPKRLGSIGLNLSLLGWSLCAIAASTGFDKESDDALVTMVEDSCEYLHGVEAETASEIIGVIRLIFSFDTAKFSSDHTGDLVNWITEGYEVYACLRRRRCRLHNLICTRVLQRIAAQVLDNFWLIEAQNDGLHGTNPFDGNLLSTKHFSWLAASSISRSFIRTFRDDVIAQRVQHLLCNGKITAEARKGLEAVGFAIQTKDKL